MIITYEDRKIEVTDFELFDSGFVVHSANFIDGDMRDLTSGELLHLESNYFESLYEAMSKGSGY